MNQASPNPVAAHPVLPPRQAEILLAVRQAFVEKGFDGASMQDLARAAGMSVGNFYRYFPSKSAIIRAMVLADAQEIRADFDMVLAAPDPLAALRQGMRERICGPSCTRDSALWVEIDAAARRTPEVAEAQALIESEVKSRILSVLAVATGLPFDAAERRFSTHVSFLLVLFKAAGSASHRPDLDVAALRDMIIAAMERVFDEILASAAVPPE